MITRSFSNMGSSDYIKPLSDEKALESGAEFLGEIIAYGTLFTWGIYEVNKLSKDTKAKEKAVSDNIANLHAQIQGIQSDYQRMMNDLEKFKEDIAKNNEKIEKLETLKENE